VRSRFILLKRPRRDGERRRHAPRRFYRRASTLPFGTLVVVDNQDNRRWTVVRITDRGPFIGGRIIDVSQVAARELGISGLTRVCLKIVSIPEDRTFRGN
jgi:rare lipoprotein A